MIYISNVEPKPSKKTFSMGMEEVYKWACYKTSNKSPNS